MKQLRKIFLPVAGLALFAAVSCAGGNQMKESDLLHRRFVLESVDGKPFENALRTPDIEFGEGFRVYGQVCNRYTGQGRLAGNVLTVKQAASTMMLCPDDALDKLERDFSRMLEDGAALEFSGDTLTLRGGGRTLVYKAGSRER